MMRFTPIILAFSALSLASACSPNVETRGYLKQENWESKLIPQQTHQQDVLAMLGSPSAKSTFGPDVWYYITTRRESYAFLAPEIAKKDVVEVAFQPDGYVETVTVRSGEEARDVAIATRTTPTEGHELTFLEQLLGNVGRFNAPTRQPGQGAISRAP